jgi:hypothetical protein
MPEANRHFWQPEALYVTLSNLSYLVGVKVMQTESEHESSHKNFVVVLWKRFRSELLARPLFVGGLFTSLVMFAALFYWPIKVTKSGKLTDLEQLLFQIFLVALPASISWALAKRKEEENVLVRQKVLARSAVRRISSIGAAASRLSKIIDVRKTAITSAPEWAKMDATQRSLLFELFDGLSRQLTEMQDNIEASEGDWRDILPEEFAKKKEAEREILQAREIAVREKERAYAELEQALAQGEARTAEQIATLNQRLGKQLETVEERLLLKVEQIRSQLPSSLSPGYGISGVVTSLYGNPSNLVLNPSPQLNWITAAPSVESAAIPAWAPPPPNPLVKAAAKAEQKKEIQEQPHKPPKEQNDE